MDKDCQRVVRELKFPPSVSPEEANEYRVEVAAFFQTLENEPTVSVRGWAILTLGFIVGIALYSLDICLGAC